MTVLEVLIGKINVTLNLYEKAYHECLFCNFSRGESFALLVVWTIYQGFLFAFILRIKDYFILEQYALKLFQDK